MVLAFSNSQILAFFFASAFAIYAMVMLLACAAEIFWESWDLPSPSASLKNIVERVAHQGESYFTRTPADYYRALRSACGGGWLTAGTVTLKFLITWAKLPLFIEATAVSLNYAGSFLLMQGLGFRLATKQPAMLAATLAGRLRHNPHWKEIAAVTRSLVASAAGNLALVTLAAWAGQFAYSQIRGETFLSQSKAITTLASLHPFSSATVPCAILTGVILWVASLVSGWVADWRQNTLWEMDAAASKRWGAVAFNVSLGVLLGMLPALGRALDLPLDVRHFTLSGGALTLAISSLGWSQALEHGAIAALAGVAMIGILNLVVSFGISFAISLFAQGLLPRRGRALLRSAAQQFSENPREFFLPVSNL